MTADQLFRLVAVQLLFPIFSVELLAFTVSIAKRSSSSPMDKQTNTDKAICMDVICEGG
jgi:hypothetical protein